MNEETSRSRMSLHPRRLAVRHVYAAAAIVSVGGVSAFTWADEVGWQDLLDRLGAAAPTGAGVPVVQVEAVSGGSYMPDIALPEFAGKTFTPHSGASGASWHASEVARMMEGIGYSMAWGVTNIHSYEAGSFLQSGFLKVSNSSTVPLTSPDSAKIFNCSWIGSFGSNASDNEALRRADYVMQLSTVSPLFITGENNGAGSGMQPLMSMTYNGLAVGLTTGGHSAGVVPAGIDGAGRQKPEIVAPGSFTSFSTPVVSAAAALLYQTAAEPPLNADPFAGRAVVIKSVLLAGATHRSTWANNAPQSGTSRGIATQPLDPLYGVDTVNINRSHLILTAGRTPTATSVNALEPTTLQGWMQYTFPSPSQNAAIYAEFDLGTVDNTVSIVCNWNRYLGTTQFPGGMAAPSVANLDVTLYRVVNDVLTPITGTGGTTTFSFGNAASRSTVDNVEHLFIRGLREGRYVLEVKRLDALVQQTVTAVSWFIDQGPLYCDLNEDGKVNGSDLGILLGHWSQPGVADVNRDGNTDGSDLGVLLGHWTG